MSVYVMDPRYEETLQKYEQKLSSMEEVMENMAIALQEYQRRFRFQNKAVKFIAEYLLHKFGFNLWLRIRREGPNIDSLEEDEDLASLADQYCHPVVYGDRNEVMHPVGVKVQEGPKLHPVQVGSASGERFSFPPGSHVVYQSGCPTTFTPVFDLPHMVLTENTPKTATYHQGGKRASHEMSTSTDDTGRQEYVQLPPKVPKTSYVFPNESQSQYSNPTSIYSETSPSISTPTVYISGSRSSASSQASSHSRSSTPAGVQTVTTSRTSTPIAIQTASAGTAHSRPVSRGNQATYSIMSTQTDPVDEPAPPPPPRRSHVVIHKEVPNIIEIDISGEDEEASCSSKSPSVIMPTPVFEMCPYKTETEGNEQGSHPDDGQRVGDANPISKSPNAPPRSFIKTKSNSHVVEIVYDVTHSENVQLGYDTPFPDEEQEIPVTALPRKSKKIVKDGAQISATTSAAIPSRPSSASQLRISPQPDVTKKHKLVSQPAIGQSNERSTSVVAVSSGESLPLTSGGSTKHKLFSSDAPAQTIGISNTQLVSRTHWPTEAPQQTNSFDVNWLFQMKQYQRDIMPYSIFIKKDELRQWFEYLPNPDPTKSRYRCRFCSKYAQSYGIPRSYVGPVESAEGQLKKTEEENRSSINCHNRKQSHQEIINRMIKEGNRDLSYISHFDKETKRELMRKLEL